MTVKELSNLPRLDAPGNATRTSDYEIAPAVWEAYLAALERADDLLIAVEIRTRDLNGGDRVELNDFIREQGYDPADFAP
jgi:hypothetical protein